MAKITTLPPDLLKMIVEKILSTVYAYGSSSVRHEKNLSKRDKKISPEKLVRNFLFSSPKLSPLWYNDQYWYSLGSKTLGISKSLFEKYISRILLALKESSSKFRNLKNVPYMVLLIVTDPTRVVDIMNHTCLSYAYESKFEKARNFSFFLSKGLKKLENTEIPDKTGIRNKLKELQNLYDEELNIFIAVTPKQCEEFSDFLRKYEKSFRRKNNPPRLIVLPDVVFYEELGIEDIDTENIFSLIKFKNSYLQAYRRERTRVIPKEIQRKLDDIRLYDIISFGEDNPYFHYVRLASVAQDKMEVIISPKFLIPGELYRIFDYYGIKYNEDINELYGTAGQIWKYKDTEIDQTLTLASRNDPAEDVQAMDIFLDHIFYVKKDTAIVFNQSNSSDSD
jgi:hypothetical protein